MKIFNPIGYDYVTVVEILKQEISEIDLDVCEQPKQTLGKYYESCKDKKPDIIINGGFFGLANGDPCFNLENEGRMYAETDLYQEGIGIKGSSDLILSKAKAENWRDFISAYPVLMRNGSPVHISIASEINYKARRSILGYTDDKIYLIAVEKPGLTFSGCQTLLSELGVDNAINLDGGGSTKILKDGKSITSNSYNRAVDNVICIYLKKDVLYRVQTGAYSKYANALVRRTQVRALKDTIGAGYKNAYIRQIDGLYKVQVGAFSKRENALKVTADLKTKGIDSFITTV